MPLAMSCPRVSGVSCTPVRGAREATLACCRSMDEGGSAVSVSWLSMLMSSPAVCSSLTEIGSRSATFALYPRPNVPLGRLLTMRWFTI